ncbi:MAG: hypothetical protein NXI30_12710 [bacterium]|nr:hypothetical protein [bacterium]
MSTIESDTAGIGSLTTRRRGYWGELKQPSPSDRLPSNSEFEERFAAHFSSTAHLAEFSRPSETLSFIAWSWVQLCSLAGYDWEENGPEQIGNADYLLEVCAGILGCDGWGIETEVKAMQIMRAAVVNWDAILCCSKRRGVQFPECVAVLLSPPTLDAVAEMVLHIEQFVARRDLVLDATQSVFAHRAGGSSDS